jgi:Uncharacterized conserved protein
MQHGHPPDSAEDPQRQLAQALSVGPRQHKAVVRLPRLLYGLDLGLKPRGQAEGGHPRRDQHAILGLLVKDVERVEVSGEFPIHHREESPISYLLGLHGAQNALNIKNIALEAEVGIVFTFETTNKICRLAVYSAATLASHYRFYVHLVNEGLVAFCKHVLPRLNDPDIADAHVSALRRDQSKTTGPWREHSTLGTTSRES